MPPPSAVLLAEAKSPLRAKLSEARAEREAAVAHAAAVLAEATAPLRAELAEARAQLAEAACVRVARRIRVRCRAGYSSTKPRHRRRRTRGHRFAVE